MQRDLTSKFFDRFLETIYKVRTGTSRPNELLAVQIFTFLPFCFFVCLCCGVMLAVFFCPVIIVEFNTIFI